MQERHRSGLDPAGEAITHHQIGAAAQFLQERADVIQGVAVVRIGHQHVPPARGIDASAQSRAVPTAGHVHEPRAFASGDFLRAVRRPIVGNNYLATHAKSLQRGEGLADAYG